jgi:hypothetical protein
VLDVRMGLFAAELLGIDLSCINKRLLIISETDGCFVDRLNPPLLFRMLSFQGAISPPRAQTHIKYLMKLYFVLPFIHPYVMCGDYPTDNHSKTSPYIAKCPAIGLFALYALPVINAHRGAAS